MSRSLHICLLLALGFSVCRGEGPPPETADAATATLPPGESRVAVDGGSIWCRVTGGGAGAPLILLHGGPGFSSLYLKPLEALGDERPVVRYDQLGGGRSDRFTDTTRFTIPHFVAELDSLRSHLGYERIHVYGHSWGTILGVEYYRAHPDRVVSLTLASPAVDIPAWERSGRALVATLSDSAQRAIAAAEGADKFDDPAFQAAMEEFYGKYVFRHPVQPDLDSLFATASQEIYGYMWGPSEFTARGTLRGYDAKPLLAQVKVPVLYTVGQFDEADPEVVRQLARATPGAQLVVIDTAAHLTTWDNPEQTVASLRQFLRSVESGAVR